MKDIKQLKDKFNITEKSIKYKTTLGREKAIRKSSLSKAYLDEKKNKYYFYNKDNEKLFSINRKISGSEELINDLIQIVSYNKAEEQGFIMEPVLEELLEKERPISDKYIKRVKTWSNIWCGLNFMIYVILGIILADSDALSIDKYAALICVPILNMYAFAWKFSDVVSWCEPGKINKYEPTKEYKNRIKKWKKNHVIYLIHFLIIVLPFLVLSTPVWNMGISIIKGEILLYLFAFAITIAILCLFVPRIGKHKSKLWDYITISLLTLGISLFLSYCIMTVSGKETCRYESPIIEFNRSEKDGDYIMIGINIDGETKLQDFDADNINVTKDFAQVVHYEGLLGIEWVRIYTD